MSTNLIVQTNSPVRWDRHHWNISPGSLAKMLVLATLTDMRMPLSHLEDRLEGIDTEYFLDPMDKSTCVKDQTRIQVLNMLLIFSLLLRALIQYRLRMGLKAFESILK